MRYVALGAAFVVIMYIMMGCANPVCYDNPRTMRCMTPDQLERELVK